MAYIKVYKHRRRINSDLWKRVKYSKVISKQTIFISKIKSPLINHHVELYLMYDILFKRMFIKTDNNDLVWLGEKAFEQIRKYYTFFTPSCMLSNVHLLEVHWERYKEWKENANNIT